VNEAYILLNIDYKQKQSIIETAKKISCVKEVKSVYGIYDILVILESSDIQQIKNSIDDQLYKMEGVNNLTSLISVG
jgi:DNA-binding Lrp family transcriptional regulator